MLLSRSLPCRAASRSAAVQRRSTLPMVCSNGSGSRIGLAKVVDDLNRDHLKTDLPRIKIGDTVRLGFQVKEGKGKTRTQRLEGVVIGEHGATMSMSKTIRVRRIFQGVGIEFTLPVHSTLVSSIEVLKSGKVRRAKLYYLRKLSGKGARLKEVLPARKVKGAAAAAAEPK